MIFKNRKGISTFIATLLLMVLAVAAGVVIYAYTMGYLGGFGSPQTMGGISIDTWSLTPGTNLVVYVRNIGKTTFQLDTVYVNGVKVTDPIMADLPETGVGSLTIIDTQYHFVGSTTYDVKIIGKDNTQISFQVKK